MKTLQEQYTLINEGKGDKNFFLKQARHLFPEYVNQYTDYNNAVKILKSKSILHENINTISTSTKSIFQIFKENINEMNMDKVYKVFDYFKDKSYEFTKDVKPVMNKMGLTSDEQQEVEVMLFDYDREYDEIDEILAEAIGVKNKKEYGDQNEFESIDKDVQKALDNKFDYKDKKNIDNVYGTSFLNGYYAEMKDPKNSKKTPDEIKQIVLKNMDKNINYYAENAMFGTKGVGFKEMKDTEPVKGKYKSSGYGDLKK
jgi:hypothetical protein